jgi:RimJ/RimL family protein N-acetyltransferase
MIHELKETEFDKARPVFFNLAKYQLGLLTVLEGNKFGRIFVDDKKNPSSGFCFLESIFFMFAGSSRNTKFNKKLKKVFVNDIFPNHKTKYNYFIAFPDNGWGEELKEIFGELSTDEGVYYELNRSERKEWECTLQPDFTIERVDRDFFERKLYTIPDEIWIEQWLTNMYGSLESFYERGFAFSVVHKKKLVVSFCYCKILSKDKSRSELGITTKEDFQRMGLGKNLVFHTLDHCWDAGVKIDGWHTNKDNIASIKLAESVGYKFNRSYPMFFGSWLKE